MLCDRQKDRLTVRLKKWHRGGCHTQNNFCSNSLPEETVELVTTFYADDSISRVIPGKMFYQFDVMTIRKKKKRKRLLLDNISNIYKKFQKLYPDHEIEKS